jgi:hypothetical protein
VSGKKKSLGDQATMKIRGIFWYTENVEEGDGRPVKIGLQVVS